MPVLRANMKGQDVCGRNEINSIDRMQPPFLRGDAMAAY